MAYKVNYTENAEKNKIENYMREGSVNCNDVCSFTVLTESGTRGGTGNEENKKMLCREVELEAQGIRKEENSVPLGGSKGTENLGIRKSCAAGWRLGHREEKKLRILCRRMESRAQEIEKQENPVPPCRQSTESRGNRESSKYRSTKSVS
ncbi:MAG: hypothetical protein Q4B03_06810 [Lachnospiraceae bacterium]|nr:hypothetical protein [Lachnospiraceae bacterium]